MAGRMESRYVGGMDLRLPDGSYAFETAVTLWARQAFPSGVPGLWTWGGELWVPRAAPDLYVAAGTEFLCEVDGGGKSGIILPDGIDIAMGLGVQRRPATIVGAGQVPFEMQ